MSDRDEERAAPPAGEAEAAEESANEQPTDAAAEAAGAGPAERGDASDGEAGEEKAAGTADDDAATTAAAEAEKKNRRQRRAAKARGTEDEPAPRDKNKRLREARRRESQERQAAVAAGLDATEIVDDAFTRTTHGVTEFLKKNASLLQLLAVLAAIGGMGWLVYDYRAGRRAEADSQSLFQGLGAQLGFVTSVPEPDALRPTFETDQKRLEAARGGYEAAQNGKPGSGPVVLAELGLAGVLYDQGKYDEAKAKYESVKQSQLAQRDADVKARCIEGIGLALEAKGDPDGAQKAFQELENSGIPGMTALALVHQARLATVKGDKVKAKELLTKVDEKRDKGSPLATTYVDDAARRLRGVLDPSASAETASALGDLSPEELKKFQEEMQKDPKKLQEMLERLGKSVGQVPKPTQPIPLDSAVAPAGSAP